MQVVAIKPTKQAVFNMIQNNPTVIVDFWGAHCPNCPKVIELVGKYQKYIERTPRCGIQVISICLDNDDEMELLDLVCGLAQTEVFAAPTVIVFERGAANGMFIGSSAAGELRVYMREKHDIKVA
jgi:thiol-disulfide isomerase/thioredoxin